MSRYWIKTDEVVEGPYEAGLLKFLPGFREDSLVSPDEVPEEIWTKAAETRGLQSLFQGSRFLIDIPQPGVEQSPPFFVPDLEESPTAAEDLKEPQAPSLDSEPEKATPLPDPRSDLLEVMEKISLEILETEGKSLPSRKKSGRVKQILVASGCLVLAAVGFWVWHRIMDKFQKREVAHLIQEKPDFALHPAENKHLGNVLPIPVRISVKPAKSQSKSVSKPKLQAKNGSKPPRKSPEEAEEELKSQKYILPGVPSPNIKSANIKKEPVENEKKAEVTSPKSGDTGKKEPEGQWFSQDNWGE